MSIAGSWILQHDNVPAHTALSHNSWQIIQFLPFHSDPIHLDSSTSALLSEPCPIRLPPLLLSLQQSAQSFLQLQNWLDEFFTAKPADFLKRGIKNLPERWKAVMNNGGKYIIDWLFICVKNKLCGSIKKLQELMHQPNMIKRLTRGSLFCIFIQQSSCWCSTTPCVPSGCTNHLTCSNNRKMVPAKPHQIQIIYPSACYLLQSVHGDNTVSLMLLFVCTNGMCEIYTFLNVATQLHTLCDEMQYYTDVIC
jgi:hypothetical protein